MRRQEAGFDAEEGGRLTVDGRGRDGLNSPCTRTFVRQISTASCEEHCFFWDGGELEPTEVERPQEQVRMIGPSELR